MNILITGAFSSLNRGDEARVRCAISALQDVLPDVHFVFLTPQPDNDRMVYRDIRLSMMDRDRYARVLEHSKLFGVAKAAELLLVILGAALWRVSGGLIGILRAKEFLQYDIFIDLSGESLTDYYGFFSLIRCLYPLLVGLTLKKRVVVFCQSIGPIRHVLGRIALRLILNRVSLIITRDEYSIHLLSKYNISLPRIYMGADPAFLLEPAPPERVKQILLVEGIDLDNSKQLQRPVIGVSLSRGAHRHAISGRSRLDERYQNFLQVAASALDFLVERMDAEVVFIPHVVSQSQDDRITAASITALAKWGHRFKLINGAYSATELKGLIGRCDLFVGSRMHANIAALSSLVPTIAVAYSFKMIDLMERLQLGDFVCSIEDVTVEELTAKIILAWQKRKTIQNILAANVQDMQRLARESARQVAVSIAD